MGLVHVGVWLGNPADRSRRVELEFLADSGSLLSWVPASTLAKLGIEATGSRQFQLADGRVVERPVGGAVFEYDGLVAFSNVVFGDEGSLPLLGVTTIETMGAAIDPVEQRLKAYKTLLACTAWCERTPPNPQSNARAQQTDRRAPSR